MPCSCTHSRACGSPGVGQQQGWGGDREYVAVFLQCQLSGLWRNDQDSLMEISVLRDNGDFQGQYLTKVTLSGGCAQISPLRGAQQQLGEEGWPTFAFTVRWDNFSNASTAFVGQCFVDAGGKETLSTMWLLREAVGSLEEDWKATR
ncbi:hypothetical protein DV515_00011054 [Chloebia gouldiae]|uniref:Avidin n=1 Tax=Chloebia gouldiae TaxID=44316 RepID=A0A3L8S7M0_CHLGU|nr:hypothetical protein DV515_00011054 [Chloebia gouldiae]